MLFPEYEQTKNEMILSLEYGLKTGDLSEEEIIKIFNKALNKCAKESEDPRIQRGRKKMNMYTGPFGTSTPDAEPPEYDHIYFFDNRRNCNLFLQLYPNTERNGRVKFPQEGIIWNLYISDSNGNEVTKGVLENLEMDAPNDYGIQALREIFRTLPCEKILIKEYIRGENRL